MTDTGTPDHCPPFPPSPEAPPETVPSGGARQFDGRPGSPMATSSATA